MKTRLRAILPVPAVLLGCGLLAWFFWSGSPDTVPAAVSRADAGPYVVRLITDSVPRGVAEIGLDITGGANSPAEPDSVSVEPTMTQMGHAAIPVPAAPHSPGEYRAPVSFHMLGLWDITVRITSGDETYEAVLNVTVVN